MRKNLGINGINQSAQSRWESRNSMHGEPGEQVNTVANVILSKLIESETHPLVAIHGLLLAIMRASLSCQMDKHEIRDLIGENAEDLYAIAEQQFSSQFSIKGDKSELDVSSGVVGGVQ